MSTENATAQGTSCVINDHENKVVLYSTVGNRPSQWLLFTGRMVARKRIRLRDKCFTPMLPHGSFKLHDHE
jgi:hypothetical protein